jgi:hypothetical protein
MATETGATDAEASTTEVESTTEEESASKPVPGPGKILIWSVHFPACDPDNPDDPEQPASTVTASVTLDDQDGAIVHAKAASVIDYQSGAISRGAPVEVRYESPEDEASDNPVWVFDLVDAVGSNSS